MFRKMRKLIVPVLGLCIAGLAIASMTGSLTYRLYAVKTGSMTPLYPAKSLVIVQVGSYRVGQVVTYVKDSGLVTHRLMAINANGTITTKGDANQTADPWHVKRSAIVGGVIYGLPMAGYWLVYLKNPLGLGSLADLVVIIWLIFALAETKPEKQILVQEESVVEPSGNVPTVPVIDGLALAVQRRSQSSVI
jgi:signal peptidase I